MLSLSSQNENKHREFKLPPFCRAVVSIANLIGTSPSRVETIRAWLKPAHSFCRGVRSVPYVPTLVRTSTPPCMPKWPVSCDNFTGSSLELGVKMAASVKGFMSFVCPNIIAFYGLFERFFFTELNLCQEPMTRSLQLPYWAYVTAFFTDRSIFRLSFPEKTKAVPVRWPFHRAPVGVIHGKFNLKINRSVKTPWHEHSRVVGSRSWPPASAKGWENIREPISSNLSTAAGK